MTCNTPAKEAFPPSLFLSLPPSPTRSACLPKRTLVPASFPPVPILRIRHGGGSDCEPVQCTACVVPVRGESRGAFRRRWVDVCLFQRAPAAHWGHTPLLPLLNSPLLPHGVPRTPNTAANDSIRRYVRTCDLLVLPRVLGVDFKCTAVALLVLTRTGIEKCKTSSVHYRAPLARTRLTMQR